MREEKGYNIRQRIIEKEGERGAVCWIGNIFILKFITLSLSLSHSLTPSLLLPLCLRPISHLSISYFLSLSLFRSILKFLAGRSTILETEHDLS